MLRKYHFRQKRKTFCDQETIKNMKHNSEKQLMKEMSQAD